MTEQTSGSDASLTSKAPSAFAMGLRAFFVTMIAVGLSASAYFAVSTLLEDKLLTACEKRIQERLVAPATYKRVSIYRTELKLTGEEFKRKLLEDDPQCRGVCQGLLKMYDAKTISPATYDVSITYDANNSFNAPLRQTEECSYFSTNGFPEYIVDVDLKFNGRSKWDELKGS